MPLSTNQPPEAQAAEQQRLPPPAQAEVKRYAPSSLSLPSLPKVDQQAEAEEQKKSTIAGAIIKFLITPLSELFSSRPKNSVEEECSVKEKTMFSELTKVQPSYLKTSIDIFRRVFNGNPALTTVYALSSISSGILQVAPWFLIGQLTTSLNQTKSLESVAIAGFGAISCFYLRNFLGIFHSYLEMKLQVEGTRSLENNLLKDIHSRSQFTISSSGFNDILNNVRENFSRSMNFMYRNMTIVSSLVGAGFATFLIADKAPPQFTMGMVLLGVLALFNEYRSAKRFENTEKKVAEPRRRYWYDQFYVKFKEGIREFKHLLKSKEAIDSVEQRYREVTKPQLNDAKHDAINSTYINLLALGLTAGLFIRLMADFFGGVLQDSGQFITVILMAGSFKDSLSAVSSIIGQQQKDYTYASQALAIGKIGEPDLDVNKTYHQLDRRVTPMITFQGVSYHSDSGKEILSGINITFKPGQFYGICGDSGAGKTSLIRLLTLENKLTVGTILIDNYPIYDVHPDDVRAIVGYLPQDYLHFASYSVRDAVKLAIRKGETDVSFEKACETACIDFLGDHLKDADKTIGAEFSNSRDFSGGEAQRIALARSIIKDAPVLVLDEPTARLGIRHKKAFFANLLKFAKDNNRTLVLITHDYVNFREADQIFYFENGKLVEQGTHQELLAMRRGYATRYNKELEQYLQDCRAFEDLLKEKIN
ncbi:MAG TPA: ABC transporter ATP-binding protein [Oligoflexia bacterium]|nr:ABC transporter ATP-binding protein [Oligoflexia bacterium]HMP26442.1 ABC transporter ATP-binding protein [Oligoflexia bacterium]